MDTTTITPFALKASDGATIASYRAVPSGNVKAIVQIAHGMAEHFRRYARLTQKLTAKGYAVFANDHRGHGDSVKGHGLGNFGPRGFQALVDDMATLSQVAKQELPGKPLVLLGHSMGSFAAQLYLLEHHRELAGVVLSGTAAMDKLLESLLASGEPVTLELLNAGFEPARTSFDWLSRDPAEVDKYIADPLCGFTVEDASTRSMYEIGTKARFDPRLGQVRKDLPIYVISGERDPVVGPGQSFANALIDSYKGFGLKDIVHRVYEGGRHEMFNETNREQVEDELIAWLENSLPLS